MIGMKLGKLTVVKDLEKTNKFHSKLYECICDCGNLIIKSSQQLKAPDTIKHCGCEPRKEHIRNPHLNLIGQKYGRLTVLEYAGKTKSNSTYRYLCICDCGNRLIVPTSHLRNSNTKSCGCLKKEKVSLYDETGDVQIRRLMKQYLSGAVRRNLEFHLNLNEFSSLIKEKCLYCNTPPYKKSIRKDSKHNMYILYTGIDRIDSTKGYTVDNVCPCCEICNRAKSDLSQEVFLKYIERIRNNGVNNEV